MKPETCSGNSVLQYSILTLTKMLFKWTIGYKYDRRKAIIDVWLKSEHKSSWVSCQDGRKVRETEKVEINAIAVMKSAPIVLWAWKGWMIILLTCKIKLKFKIWLFICCHIYIKQKYCLDVLHNLWIHWKRNKKVNILFLKKLKLTTEQLWVFMWNPKNRI